MQIEILQELANTDQNYIVNYDISNAGYIISMCLGKYGLYGSDTKGNWYDIPFDEIEIAQIISVSRLLQIYRKDNDNY